MTRTVFLLSLGFATTAIASVIAVAGLVRAGLPAPGEVRSGSVEERISELETKLATGIERIQEVAAQRARSDDPSGPESAGADVLELSSDPLGALSRLDKLELRVAGLEKEPLARGLEHVESDDAAVRRRGVRELKKLAVYDPEAIRAIRALLGDPDEDVRLECVDAIADLKDRESIGVVRELLSDSDAKVRRQTIDTLVKLDAGEAAVSIANLLKDTSGKVREEAADALGKLGSRQGAALLVGALQDPDADVRAEAITSVAKVLPDTAVGHLREAYAAGDEKNLFRLVGALRKLGDSQPFDTEVARLSALALNDPDDDARRKAIRTLAKHAREESKLVFDQALADANPRVRKEAKRALTAR